MRIDRPGLVTALAVFQFIGAAFWLLVAAAVLLGSALSESPSRNSVVPLCVIVGGFGVLLAICGLGLWRLRPYGRILQIVFACIGLLALPFGTVISILILVYLTRPGMKVVFSGKPAEALTTDERARLATLTQPSAIVVVLVAIVAAVGTFVTVSIVAAIAIPGLLRARMNGNEAGAIATMSEIATAQAIYAGSCGNGGFASSMLTLTDPTPGGKSLVAPELRVAATSGRFGYFFTVAPGAGGTSGAVDCNGAPTVTAWYATATPQTYGSTGTRSFATNAGAAVWQSPTPEPPTEPFGPPAVVVRAGSREP